MSRFIYWDANNTDAGSYDSPEEFISEIFDTDTIGQSFKMQVAEIKPDVEFTVTGEDDNGYPIIVYKEIKE